MRKKALGGEKGKPLEGTKETFTRVKRKPFEGEKKENPWEEKRKKKH